MTDMTDKKLTDDEIIKRLERCVKRGNRNHDTDIVLGLIKRQKAEIERLKECPKCVYEYDGEVMEYCVQSPCSNFKTIEQIKAEAYKEFAMKLQAFCKRIIAQKWNEKAAPISWSYAYADFIDDIDNLLKEMVGEGE